MATIKDVAQRAGVGVGTVSRVLNQSGPVSDATRERVVQAIAALQFRPSHMARQLATARTLTIGVILPFLTRPFFVSVLRGIEACIADTHYHLHLFNVETTAKRDYYFTEVPYRRRLDGLLVISLTLEAEHVARLRALNLPTVLIDTRYPGLSSVGVDNVTGGQRATEHLIELGHRRIGYISGLARPELDMASNSDRLAGYRRALQQHDLADQPQYIVMEGDGREVGYRMAEQLLRLPTPPTAIFAANDELAMGALQAAQRRGLRVPDDLALIGFDDIELAPFLNLTTMRQPMSGMGRRGVELLLRQLADRDAPAIEETLPVELIVRATTVGERAVESDESYAAAVS